MCGIAGVIRFDGRPVAADEVGGMVDTLLHRGPDDRGVYTDQTFGMGQRRLSIIDLSAAGHQPMLTPDGTIAIAFNGEIYNFVSLRRELESLGVTFRSRSDTEVALQAFAVWGRKAFARFNGMFAIAFWERTQRRLTLVRDRFGIKPLYLSKSSQRLCFGSEVKALRVVEGGIDEEVDPQALAEYMFYGNALGRSTLYTGVRRLLPGTWMEVENGGIREGSYWSVAACPAGVTDGRDAVSSVRAAFQQAVERQMVSDVPVGAFLSGGVDSTAVVAAAAGASKGRLKTYTVQFDFSPNSDDVVASRRVAAHFGTEHHEIEVAGYELRDVLERLLDAHDLPFGDAANVPLYLLSQALGGAVKVVLQGDGGDELFGGYRRYSLLSRIALLGPACRALLPMLPIIPDSQSKARLARMAVALAARDPALRMALLLTEEKPDCSPVSILSPALRESVQGVDAFARYRQVAEELGNQDAVQAMLYTDCSILLPDIFLEKVDRATMAHSLEVRVPLLDHDLADLVLGLPSATKLPAGAPKGLFKEALRGLVPEYVLKRKKAGFGVPYSSWIRGPLRPALESLLLGGHSASGAMFDIKTVSRLVREHVEGTRDHGFLLWKAMALAMWGQRQAGITVRG